MGVCQISIGESHRHIPARKGMNTACGGIDGILSAALAAGGMILSARVDRPALLRVFPTTPQSGNAGMFSRGLALPGGQPEAVFERRFQ